MISKHSRLFNSDNAKTFTPGQTVALWSEGMCQYAGYFHVTVKLVTVKNEHIDCKWSFPCAGIII